jgi:hypothetical protein
MTPNGNGTGESPGGAGAASSDPWLLRVAEAEDSDLVARCNGRSGR